MRGIVERAWPATVLQGYDATVLPRLGMIVTVTVGIALAAVGVLLFHVRTPVYAKPLNHHVDVLRQR